MTTLEDCKKPFHKHLMLRGYARYAPTSTEEVVQWLRKFIEFLDMKILQGPFSSYVDAVGNRGVTAVAMIETSHIAFHLWDEESPGLLQFDVYTCGALDVDGTLTEVRSFFDIEKADYMVFDREHGFDLVLSGQIPAVG